MIKIPNEVIFSILRTLKQVNLGDLYYEAYLGHLTKRGKDFFDIYHFAWGWALEHHPKRILEIGVRTGISICQLMSAYIDTSIVERVVLCDLFDDGFISENLVKLNLETLGINTNAVEFLTGDSKKRIPKFIQNNPDYKFDYILVDGDHSEEGAYTDLCNVYQLVDKNGVIVFDDIGPDGMNLLSVWNKFKNEHIDEFDWNENLNGKGIAWGIKR